MLVDGMTLHWPDGKRLMGCDLGPGCEVEFDPTTGEVWAIKRINRREE